MHKTFVIGDIHGGLHALKQVISRAKVDFSDNLIFLGDYVDGWSQSLEVIDYLMLLKKKHNCIFIRGNHDDLLLSWLENNPINMSLWYKNGGESTINSYRHIAKYKIKKHVVFLKSLLNYYIDKNNRLFIHAGFTNMKGVEIEYFKESFYWDRTLWETAVALDLKLDKKNECYPSRLKIYEEVFIGHTPVTRIGSTTPVNKACVWNIDTGAGFKGCLTIMNVDSKEFWQSDPLSSLYPDEKGRN